LTKSGYTFAGWNSRADGTGTTYAAGSSILPVANTTLYAKWVSTSELANTGSADYLPIGVTAFVMAAVGSLLILKRKKA
jgi:uncharacterized repeat protein (TIGR02543 family)/LPXTG-motif cell wall-anchored protein